MIKPESLSDTVIPKHDPTCCWFCIVLSSLSLRRLIQSTENENPVDDVRGGGSISQFTMMLSPAPLYPVPVEFASDDELESKMTTTNACDRKIPRNLRRETRMILVLVTVFVVGATFLFHSQLHYTPNSTHDDRYESVQMISTKLTTTESSTIQWKGTRNWVRLVVLPIVAEVGGFVLFQRIGMPLFHPLLQAGRRLLCMHQPWNRVFLSSFAHTMPRSMRNVPRFVAKLFKKRSRLSVASEFTNFVGNEEEL